MKIAYAVIRRKIKNPRLEFKLGQFQVVIPQGVNFDIPAFLDRHKAWINKRLIEFTKLAQQVESIELNPRLFAEFEQEVKSLVFEYTKILNVTPKFIKYKTMRSRWGSCSGTGVITLNLKLRYFSSELIGYVIFHEMVHLIEKNHGARFYRLLIKAYPDYHSYDKELRAYDYLLHKNLINKRKVPLE